MTTTRSTISLEPVGAALVTANDALAGGADNHVVREALVALCTASHDALAQWQDGDSGHAPEGASSERETWRTALDELRVQAALVEMEVREAKDRGTAVADRLLHAVDARLASARRDLGDALSSLRDELHKALP